MTRSSTPSDSPAARPFSDRSIKLAARMLRIVLKEPNEQERIDALAAVCSVTIEFKRERPEQWRRLTSHDVFGRPR